MGYRDYELALSTSQAVGANANTEDYLDTEITNPKWGEGTIAGIMLTCEVAAGGTTGIEFIICHSASTQPTTGATDICSFKIPTAQLVAGAKFFLPLPQGITILRYLGGYYNLINSDEVSGTFSAYFTSFPVAG